MSPLQKRQDESHGGRSSECGILTYIIVQAGDIMERYHSSALRACYASNDGNATQFDHLRMAGGKAADENALDF